jgi:hypothetical protein
MSSSTSSSDVAGFRAFTRLFCGLVAFLLLGILALFLALDPYGTGRWTPFDRPGMYDTGPRMAHASRTRDQAFDAAIIGNSTIQLLSPDRLNASTGRRFVQLSVPGTGPKEHVAMIEHLLWRRGTGLKTLVLGLGYAWCDPKRAVVTVNPFPFWLYDTNPFTYARGLFRMDTLEALPRRIGLLMGREKMARQDGYWDYELIPEGYQKFATRTLKVPELSTVSGPQKSAAAELESLLKSLPGALQVVLVHPPVFSPVPPQMTQQGLAALGACKAEIMQAITVRPGTQIIDAWIDDENTRNRALFFDHDHYRSSMAMILEGHISALMAKPR